jgi:transcriptional antiterminator
MLRSDVELETTATTPIILIDQHGQITAREIAETLGMTERPVRRIIAELNQTTRDSYT